MKLLPLFLILGLLIPILISTPFKTKTAYWIKNESGQKLNLTDDATTSCTDPKSLSDANGEFEESAQVAFYNSQLIDYPKTSLQALSDNQEQTVLGAKNSSGEEKWIEVSLATQTLRAWEGNHIFMEFPISSGLWFPTPPGDYSVYWKLRYTRMRGGSKDLGTYYDLPNVPDVMYFYQGYGLHGAYWHNNFGHPMSHGCVNEPLDKAHILFEWAGPHINPDQNSVRATPDNPGSRVFIH